ncbi:molybdopterin-guanine dinucleotide biosynthesis adapter protein [Clostridiales bacterium]|nr:molybdopterin-guanine dinucleotide biosynthesis adapter protein [Clostridiales bacterium]
MSKIIAVSGNKNSGKTTLIERLTARFLEMGINTAVIKHDGHKFKPDRDGTDTSRFYEAGAIGTVIVDREKIQIVYRKSPNMDKLLKCFSEADIILLEGFKSSNYPKLWICSGDSKTEVKNIIAWIGNTENSPCFDGDDIEGIADFIMKYERSISHDREGLEKNNLSL